MDMWCTKAELVLQLSALVSQREAPEFSEEELEAALYHLGSSSVNFIMCGSSHTIYFNVNAIGLTKMKSVYPMYQSRIIQLLHQNTSLKVANTQAAKIGA